MTRFNPARLRRLEWAEIVWRTRGACDVVQGRVAAACATPRWDRRHLAGALRPGALSAGSHDTRSSDVSALLARGDWMGAHRALARHFHHRPASFVIAPAMREPHAAQINRRFPDAAADARARADKRLDGRYDVLGYRDLPFDGRRWHADPVHGTTAPLVFWSRVPYLDAVCGDHKIVWELNRHQHWLELGRAHWLTGDARYRDECLAQLASWLAANPPRMGMNWASMLELGFRVMSWLWALNFFTRPDAQDDSPWLVDLLLGIDRQLAHVERHLSYYFSPNTHLLGEALALYVAGRALPELRASARREAVGRRVLLDEMARQVAPDGGHCERSAHYHRYTLDFYLLALAVARLTDDPVASRFERACSRLARAARALADDRGLLPHLGDDDGGSLLPMTRRPPDDVRDSLAIAAVLTGDTDLLVDGLPEEVWWVLGHERFADARARAERTPRTRPPASTALAVTGYYVSRHGGDHMVLDAGPHGYMNAGHAHADALALTFTHRGMPLLIDAGTASYTIDPIARDRFRSTALHNTVTLNGASQSIPRGPFHWSHVANGTARRWHTHRRFDYFVGTHDGYAPSTHHRHVLMLHADLLVVADFVASEVPARADAYWHLAPEWSVAVHEDGAALQSGAEMVDLAVNGGSLEHFHGDSRHGLGWYSPAYGVVEPTTTLRITATPSKARWIVTAFGLDPANRVRRAGVGLVQASALRHGVVIHVERSGSTDRLVIAEPIDSASRVVWQAGDVESDAALLFTRIAGGALVRAAAVDVTTVQSAAHPQLTQRHASRVSEMFQMFDGAPGPGRAQHGKDAACAESPDSLMVPR